MSLHRDSPTEGSPSHHAFNAFSWCLPVNYGFFGSFTVALLLDIPCVPLRKCLYFFVLFSYLFICVRVCLFATKLPTFPLTPAWRHQERGASCRACVIKMEVYVDKRCITINQTSSITPPQRSVTRAFEAGRCVCCSDLRRGTELLIH